MTAEPLEHEAPALWLVKQDTGEIVGRRPELREALKTIERLELELQDVERERRTQRAVIKRLYAELERDRQIYERRDEVAAIFAEWAQVCGHPNTRLTDDRFDAIRRLLEVTKPKPYPREAFTAAFAGAAFDAYRKQRRNGSWERFDDLTLICRDGTKFESFIKRAPKSHVVGNPLKPNGGNDNGGGALTA